MELNELAKQAYNEVRKYYAHVLLEARIPYPSQLEKRFVTVEDVMPYVYSPRYEHYYEVQALVLNIIRKFHTKEVEDSLNLTDKIIDMQKLRDLNVINGIKKMTSLPWIHHNYWDMACNTGIYIFFGYVYSNF